MLHTDQKLTLLRERERERALKSYHSERPVSNGSRFDAGKLTRAKWSLAMSTLASMRNLTVWSCLQINMMGGWLPSSLTWAGARFHVCECQGTLSFQVPCRRRNRRRQMARTAERKWKNGCTWAGCHDSTFVPLRLGKRLAVDQLSVTDMTNQRVENKVTRWNSLSP